MVYSLFRVMQDLYHQPFGLNKNFKLPEPPHPQEEAKVPRAISKTLRQASHKPLSDLLLRACAVGVGGSLDAGLLDPWTTSAYVGSKHSIETNTKSYHYKIL